MKRLVFLVRPILIPFGLLPKARYQFESTGRRGELAFFAGIALVMLVWMIALVTRNPLSWGVFPFVTYLMFAGVCEFLHNQTRARHGEDMRPRRWRPSAIDEGSQRNLRGH